MGHTDGRSQTGRYKVNERYININVKGAQIFEVHRSSTVTIKELRSKGYLKHPYLLTYLLYRF